MHQILSCDIHLDDRWLAQHKANHVPPEKLLLMAILLDAIHAACEPSLKGCLEAREWVERADDGNDWIFSFVNVCEVFKLDAAAARREIIRMPGYKAKPAKARIDFGCRKGRPRKKAA